MYMTDARLITPGKQTPWTKKEDDELRALVSLHGSKRWSLIANKLGTKASKQCRRRWQNFLSVELKKGGWSPQEDKILLEGHQAYGNKWTEIAKLVGGRTDNAVKNRFCALTKRGIVAGGSTPDWATSPDTSSVECEAPAVPVAPCQQATASVAAHMATQDATPTSRSLPLDASSHMAAPQGGMAPWAMHQPPQPSLPEPGQLLVPQPTRKPYYGLSIQIPLPSSGGPSSSTLSGLSAALRQQGGGQPAPSPAITSMLEQLGNSQEFTPTAFKFGNKASTSTLPAGGTPEPAPHASLHGVAAKAVHPTLVAPTPALSAGGAGPSRLQNGGATVAAPTPVRPATSGGAASTEMGADTQEVMGWLSLSSTHNGGSAHSKGGGSSPSSSKSVEYHPRGADGESREEGAHQSGAHNGPSELYRAAGHRILSVLQHSSGIPARDFTAAAHAAAAAAGASMRGRHPYTSDRHHY